MQEALGIFCSDLHLGLSRPRCRKDDWMQVQETMLNTIVEYSWKYKVPVFVAGDIFHKPKEDPLVVSMAIRCMKRTKWYGVPGQHDLPGHSIEYINTTSFWNLVEADVLHYIKDSEEQELCNIVGFPFGSSSDMKQRNPLHKDKPNIALIHKLAWKTAAPFPGAPDTGNVNALVKEYKGFDALVFGDNHQGFSTVIKNKPILNCGIACRRTIAEKEYVPRCYVLFDDLSMKALPLPYKDDIIEVEDTVTQKNDQMQVFVKTLLEQTEVHLSFSHNLKIFLETHKVSDELYELIWNIMEQANE